MKRRFRVLTAAVRPGLFWCAGSWNLTAGQASKLRGLQQQMLRRMLRTMCDGLGRGVLPNLSTPNGDGQHVEHAVQ